MNRDALIAVIEDLATGRFDPVQWADAIITAFDPPQFTEMTPGCECGATATSTLHTTRDPRGFRVRQVRCKACGRVYAWIGGRLPGVTYHVLDEQGRVHRQMARWEANRSTRRYKPRLGGPSHLRMLATLEKPIDKSD
jgi:hypothetical protein